MLSLDLGSAAICLGKLFLLSAGVGIVIVLGVMVIHVYEFYWTIEYLLGPRMERTSNDKQAQLV